MTGPNTGGGVYGSPWTMALAPSSEATFANSAGSAPPSSQYAHGAPVALANRPTSSLPDTGPGSSTRPAPKHALKASVSRAHAAGSLTTGGVLTIAVISGTAGAPA